MVGHHQPWTGHPIRNQERLVKLHPAPLVEFKTKVDLFTLHSCSVTVSFSFFFFLYPNPLSVSAMTSATLWKLNNLFLAV